MNELDKGLNGEIYHVLIVGAGQIGAFYDRPGDKDILSHAHAFTAHPHFHLLGFVDQDPVRAEQAASIWGGQVYVSIEEALAQEKVDLVCLAVPDPWHYEYLKKLAGSQVQLIWAEKPLTQTWAEAVDIKALYDDQAAPAVAVNYMRRFVPEFWELRQRIQKGEMGELLCGTAYYGKGLIHNGSHGIDLLRFLLGEIAAVRCLDQVQDFYEDDPSLSGQLIFSNGAKVVLQAIDCRPYSIFELELFFANKRIRILDSGFYMEEYDVKEDALFAGYRRLELDVTRDTSLGQAMYLASHNLYEHLAFNKPLFCTLEDGCRVMEICQHLRESEAE